MDGGPRRPGLIAEQSAGTSGTQRGGPFEGLPVERAQRIAVGKRLLYTGGAAITEVERDPAQHGDVVRCAYQTLQARVVGDRREAGHRVGLRLQGSQRGDLVLQLEDTARVCVVITASGLRGHAIDREVVADEDTQAIRPAVVEPVHHVGGVIAIEGPQSRQHAQTRARLVAQRTAIDGTLHQAAEGFLDQLAASFGIGETEPLEAGTGNPLVVVTQQRPGGVVGSGEHVADDGYVDGVSERALAVESRDGIVHAHPVDGAAIPRAFDFLRGTVAKLRGGGDVDLFQRPAQHHQPEDPGGVDIIGAAAQVLGDGTHGACEMADELAVAGGGEEKHVILIVKPSEAVVDVVTGTEIVRPQVVAGEHGSAGGTGGTQIPRQVLARPRIEAVMGKDRRATYGTALVYVDVVGPGELRRGKLAPQGGVVLGQPPAQCVLIPCRWKGFSLQGLARSHTGTCVSEGPSPGPLCVGVDEWLAQLIKAADGHVGVVRGALVIGNVQRVVAAHGWRLQVIHPGPISPGPALIDTHESGRVQRRRLPRSTTYRQPEQTIGEDHPRCPLNHDARTQLMPGVSCVLPPGCSAISVFTRNSTAGLSDRCGGDRVSLADRPAADKSAAPSCGKV